MDDALRALLVEKMNDLSLRMAASANDLENGFDVKAANGLELLRHDVEAIAQTVKRDVGA